MELVERSALIQGEATCERVWRRWLAEARFHELAVHDWLPATARASSFAPVTEPSP